MTKIEWVKDPKTGEHGKSWNPIVGCSKVSLGCANCYAETMAKRLKAMGRPEYQDAVNGDGKWTGKITLVPERLDEPLRRRKPTIYFVNSMSDLFHESVPLYFQVNIWRTMADTPQHTYQILTKRSELMAARLRSLSTTFGILPNVWLGISVENQEAAFDRIEWLIETPAAVRFLSCEPLLGSIDLDWGDFEMGSWIDHLHWVIAGGESGPKARPMHPDWARSLRDQCQAAGVPFFFKQYGAWKEIQFDKRDRGDILFSPINGIIERLPDPLIRGNTQEFKRTIAMRRIGKKAAGRLLDGREWNEMPEVAR